MRLCASIAVLAILLCIACVKKDGSYTQTEYWDGVTFSQATSDCPIAQTCWIHFEGIRPQQKVCMGEYSVSVLAGEVGFAHDVRLEPGRQLMTAAITVRDGKCPSGRYYAGHVIVTLPAAGTQTSDWNRFLNPQSNPNAPIIMK
ncbi:MAG TPA: hypothetical protein VMU12_00800 [Candidatus Paceibacterota bacterium]|nr:hypothetical protein [Candidatus Paceibacterota bacterium]